MKPLFILCLLSLHAMAQTPAVPFDVHTRVPPYQLSIPEQWGVERIAFPIEFAPQIPYKGVEDLRFAPGWNKPESADYWSYTFLWWLEGTPTLNAVTLQENLTAYYSGLVGANSAGKNIPADKVIPTNVVIRKTNAKANDETTYSGTVSMLDYMAQLPITLQCSIHVKNCKAQNRTAVFVALSPKSANHPIWEELNKIQRSFECKK